ncbi:MULTISPECIES: DUF3422 domain-containing protein [Sphingobium]|uniref:DUF3422 domain-containing protein n=1 Tax=Sphingobium fuliginis (strain ATCC 27551) TaxID=336203 RepID=A0ABQ1EXV4_SPHSA|nr:MULTISPECIES: DUF3422 domain-containing protein [Sphingobium]RYL98290.1 DUF3422 family protein [Sphingobium fuliginis]WDA35411.1 DUF3422 domain-containing protein [Sphingobium sp. YC-XJ3]GFZ90348.1 hypothetical protein GCM10019071_20460 [Sphingobium fuliginis]
MDDMTSTPADPFAALSQRDHPLRASLSREMHIRGLPRFDAPALALQFVLLVDEQQAEQGIALLSHRFPALKAGDRFLAARIGDLHFSWERHTEFMTYSFLAPVEGATLFDLAPFGDVPAWMADMLGRVIRSTQIAMVMDEPPSAAIAAHFATDDLIISDVADGHARIWSDFRLHADGFGRLLIHDKGLQGGESSQLVQRLQELGNYRKIALLGLPEAQQATPLLTALEQRLTAITSRVAQKDADADQVLEQLSALSAELAGIVARTRYRMSATRAYAEICRDRLRRLAVVPVRGYRSLDDFTERRLLPAMRTCDAFTRRLEDLAQRTAWTSALLRTRVDTALARRNRDLLASMDRRTALQLRLQHTVEGLSVVAISYYALGLWHHLKEALELQGWHLPAWIDVALFPVTIITVFLGIGQIRKVKRPSGDAH